MKTVTKNIKAWAVVTKNRRTLCLFEGKDIDSHSVHFSESDAETAAKDYFEPAIVLPCVISYQTLIA